MMPSIGCGLAWSLVGPTPILDGPLLLVPVPERPDGALRALQLLRYLCVRVLLLTQSDDVATLLRSQGCLLFLGLLMVRPLKFFGLPVDVAYI